MIVMMVKMIVMMMMMMIVKMILFQLLHTSTFRSEYICGGTLTPGGTLSVPSSPKKRITPGPGAYDINNQSTFLAPVDPVVSDLY